MRNPEAENPIETVRDWLGAASSTEPNDPNAIALATVDEAGMPDVRIVLLKEIEADGFVFYTNYESAKGREVKACPRAAFALHWKTLRRQVRVRGTVTREDGEQADAYYASRGLGSRIGAWASEQSRPLDSRETLLRRTEEMRERFGETPPRPPFWGGYRLTPVSIEFWIDGDDRLHDRFLWSRDGPSTPWSVKRLFP